MAAVRTKNRFGKRFIKRRELTEYAVDLDLCTHAPGARFMDFLEESGLLAPVRRIQFPPEIVRRINQERHPELPVAGPAEPDGPRLDAAADLMNALNNNLWADARIFGESDHVLDAPAAEQAQFIQTEFPVESFVPSEDRRIHIHETESGSIYSNVEQDTPDFYHYWQVFWLAAILRSGVHIFYPLDDTGLGQQILRGEIPPENVRARTHRHLNIEAYRELRELRQHERYFDAVGYFKAYSHNALQVFVFERDEHGRIPYRYWQQYLRREQEIAQRTFKEFRLGKDEVIEFIGKQCEWWDNARRVGPEAVAEEYKRNINAAIGLLRAARRIDPRTVVEKVGRRTGHFKPTLDVIFPDWTEEQRDLTIRSLKRWADSDLSMLPAPFPTSEAEIAEFCDWLEERGLYQYYWHFQRLVDLQRRDDPVHHAASTAEVVGLATLCEMIANEVMKDRGMKPRGNTLFPKLRKLFDPNGPIDLNPFFDRFSGLANTKSQSLSRRLAQIAQITGRGPYSPVLRAMLSLMAIRNEGAHLGLLHFEHGKVIDMIRILSMASVMIWKAR